MTNIDIATVLYVCRIACIMIGSTCNTPPLESPRTNLGADIFDGFQRYMLAQRANYVSSLGGAVYPTTATRVKFIDAAIHLPKAFGEHLSKHHAHHEWFKIRDEVISLHKELEDLARKNVNAHHNTVPEYTFQNDFIKLDDIYERLTTLSYPVKPTITYV